MATEEEVAQFKKKAEDAEKKITEIVKECKDEEGSNLGWALGSSIATELGFWLGDAAKQPKSIPVQIGIGITHAWRFVTHSDTIKEIPKALKPSCEAQLKKSIEDMEAAKERWLEKKADFEQMKRDWKEIEKSQKKLGIDGWNRLQNSLDKYKIQSKMTEQAYKEYAWAAGMATIYTAPKAIAYDKAGFEKVWSKGQNEFKKLLK